MNLNPNKKENPKGYKEIWESREMSYVVLMKSQDSSFHSRFHGDNKLSIPPLLFVWAHPHNVKDLRPSKNQKPFLELDPGMN